MVPNGRVFINGGTIQYDPFYGAKANGLVDPANNTFTNVQNNGRLARHPRPLCWATAAENILRSERNWRDQYGS